jgi:hypothetical protein
MAVSVDTWQCWRRSESSSYQGLALPLERPSESTTLRLVRHDAIPRIMETRPEVHFVIVAFQD